jgi:hypothetical protein
MVAQKPQTPSQRHLNANKQYLSTTDSGFFFSDENLVLF